MLILVFYGFNKVEYHIHQHLTLFLFSSNFSLHSKEKVLFFMITSALYQFH